MILSLLNTQQHSVNNPEQNPITFFHQTEKHPHRQLSEFFPQCLEFRPVEMTRSFALIGAVKVTYRSPPSLFKRTLNQHTHTHTPHATEIRHWLYSKSINTQYKILLTTLYHNNVNVLRNNNNHIIKICWLT